MKSFFYTFKKICYLGGIGLLPLICNGGNIDPPSEVSSYAPEKSTKPSTQKKDNEHGKQSKDTPAENEKPLLKKNSLIIGGIATASIGVAAMLSSPTSRVLSPEYKIRQDEIESFFDKIGVKYTDTDTFSPECKPLAHLDPPTDQHSLNHTEKYGRYLETKYTAPYYIKWVDDKIGYGLYADADMKKDDYLIEFTGIIKKSEDAEKSWSWGYHNGDTIVPSSTCLDASKSGNAARFINHSDEPNVSMLKVYYKGYKRIIYILKEDVKKNDALLISYGSKYFKHKPKIKLTP